jgi:predicted phosphoribosyltransferase
VIVDDGVETSAALHAAAPARRCRFERAMHGFDP